MSKSTETDTERSRQIAEAERIRQAKLATGWAMSAPTPETPAASTSGSREWRPIGAVDWAARFRPIVERARAEREERQAAFLANGGQCLRCEDQGECYWCDRGIDVMCRRIEGEIAGVVERSGLPDRFRRCTFDRYPGVAGTRDDVRGFVRDWDRRQNLILLGKFGGGKTGLMASAMQEVAPDFYWAHQRMVFTTTPSLFDRLRAGFDDGTYEQTMRECQRANLLILDDLGAEKPTEWVLERLYAIVNHRYEHELPTWGTTNLTPARLRESIGERVWSRLYEGALVLVVDGPNLRERGAA